MFVHDELEDIYILVGMLIVGLPALVFFVSGIICKRWRWCGLSSFVLFLVIYAAIDSSQEFMKSLTFLGNHPLIMIVFMVVSFLWTLLPIMIVVKLSERR